MVILGLERLAQFHEIVAAHEQGKIPGTVMWGACPTQFDPSQAPAGSHTACMWEKLPYAVEGDAKNWGRLAARHADEMLRLWTRYAPNLRDAVIDAFARTPLDTERSLPNMQGGDLLVGSFANGQVGARRPFAGAGHYRTPLHNLYLCGGSTHPGGNVTGLCGYNAARVIAADLGCPMWWHPPDAEQALRSLT
jgi:phytoene dehydrogenase-like protein